MTVKLMNKKLLTGFLTLFASVALAACGTDEAQETPTEEFSQVSEETSSETVIFTDDLGREVEIPTEIETVLGTGATSQTVLYTLVPELMVGWNSAPDADALEYLPADAADMPEIGSIFSKGKPISPEEIAALNPGVIIDLGDQKPDLATELDELQDDTGVPVIFFDGNLEDIPELYEKLGELFAIDTTEQVNYITEVLAFADENRETLQTDPKPYYLASGDNGLLTAPQDSYQTSILDYVGMTNIFQQEEAQGGGYQEVSAEQVIEWNPEMVIFQQGAGFDQKDDAPWNNLQAYKLDQIYEIPDDPFNWLSGSVNRVLGVYWLGNLAYPEVYDVDMVEEAQTFYELFYHYDLTEEEAMDLMSNSTFINN